MSRRIHSRRCQLVLEVRGLLVVAAVELHAVFHDLGDGGFERNRVLFLEVPFDRAVLEAAIGLEEAWEYMAWDWC